eukprot:4624729-Pyramimonas_sp.AAC.1
MPESLRQHPRLPMCPCALAEQGLRSIGLSTRRQRAAWIELRVGAAVRAGSRVAANPGVFQLSGSQPDGPR